MNGLHSQEVAEGVVLLDDLEGSGVRDFCVRGVGEPACGQSGAHKNRAGIAQQVFRFNPCFARAGVCAIHSRGS